MLVWAGKVSAYDLFKEMKNCEGWRKYGKKVVPLHITMNVTTKELIAGIC